MLILLKYILLPFLVCTTIVFSTIEATTLGTIYRDIGITFDIPWMTLGKNGFIISDIGHGIIYFIITLISLSCCKNVYRISVVFIIILIAANEISQIFIQTRQASWHDFIFSVSGMAVAIFVFYSLHTVNSPSQKKIRDAR